MSKKKKRQEEAAVGNKKIVGNKQLAVSNSKNLWLAFAIVAIVTFVLYIKAGLLTNGFVNWDDGDYIQSNPDIQQINISLFFSKFYVGNYQPLVMLMYSLIYHSSKLNPAAYHLVSLLFHIANCGLVMWFIYLLQTLRQAQCDPKRGVMVSLSNHKAVVVPFIVALLFGIHPLHMESVAWASELKDVMYAFGFLLSLIYYTKYIQSFKVFKTLKDSAMEKKYYWYSLLWFLFSCMSKGMAVSLPLLLLLIDYYAGRKFYWKDKVLFFVLSLIFGLVTIQSQQAADAFAEIHHSVLQQVSYVGLGFINYLLKLFLPISLSAIYPYPSFSIAMYLLPILLVGLLFLLWHYGKNKKYILFSAGFFIVTLLIVLQIIPIGKAVMADRYIYLASVGFFFLVAEVIYILYQRNKFWMVAPCLLLSFYSYQTFNRIKIWNNDGVLWNSVLAQYPDASAALYGRAVYYFDEHKIQLSLTDLNHAIAIDPKCAFAFATRGMCYFQMGDTLSALNDFNTEINNYPESGRAYYNRAIFYHRINNEQSALNDLQKASLLGFAEATKIIKR